MTAQIIARPLVSQGKLNNETMESRMQAPIGARRGIIHLGNLTLNRDTFRVSVGQESVVLGKHEFDLLEALALQPDLIIHSDDLSDMLWGETNRQCHRRLSVMVFRLRAKLAGLGPYRIESARGRGYGLVLAEQPTILGKGAFSGADAAGQYPASGG